MYPEVTLAVERSGKDVYMYSLCCYKLDHHIAHEYLKRLDIKTCSIFAGNGHTWKNCDYGNNIEKFKSRRKRI